METRDRAAGDMHRRHNLNSAKVISNHMEKSYREMLLGASSPTCNPSIAIHKDVLNGRNSVINIPRTLSLRSSGWLGGCLVGEIKDLELLSKCMSMIQVYGLGECKVKYVGGLCVLLEFMNKSVADCFLSNLKVN